jgi:FtsP/CotA-like multicopper oxidase with cupredoxin domain
LHARGRIAACASAFVIVALAGSVAWGSKLVRQVPLDASKIPQFADNLPDFSQLGRVNGDAPYSVRSEEFQQRVLPASFYQKLSAPYSAGTMVFGYGIDQGDRHYPAHAKGLYPGFTVVVNRDRETVVSYHNDLVAEPNRTGWFRNATGPSLEKTFTIDQSLHWANPMNDPMTVGGDGNPRVYLGAIAAVTHLHGAEDPSAFDGGPSEWFTPGAEGKLGDGSHAGKRGPGFVSSTYRYPNGQEPATLWFHDHTLGTTRTNVGAGLAAFYLIRGDGDDGIAGPGKLPGGRQEVELVLQDRQFDTNGQLIFPDGYPPGLDGPLQNPKLHPYWMPEFFGDVITVNGKSWPKFAVAPKRYRLRLLDGASVRFFNLQFCARSKAGMARGAHGSCLPGESVVPYYVIGDDGGLLNKPAKVQKLLFSPGERYDIVVDFARFRGQAITVRNDAVTPYPSAFAKFTPSLEGRIMRFNVANASVPDTSYNPATGAPLRGAGSTVAPKLDRIVQLPGTPGGLALRKPIADGKVVQVYRQLTLNPIFKSGGCHWPGAGSTDMIDAMILNNTGFAETTTERPKIGSTEVWDLIDLSNDDHPIHIHLVQFQVISRIPFDLQGYGAAYYKQFPGDKCAPNGGPPKPYNVANAAGALGGNPDVTPFFLKRVQSYCLDDGVYDHTTGPARPEESGWKDTVIAACGHVTRIVVRITPQDLPAIRNGVAIDYSGQNEFAFDPTDSDPTHIGKGGYPGGPGYVWHCHLIDHEDNDMMRPMLPAP